jgi:hypothetical protein
MLVIKSILSSYRILTVDINSPGDISATSVARGTLQNMCRYKHTVFTRTAIIATIYLVSLNKIIETNLEGKKRRLTLLVHT